MKTLALTLLVCLALQPAYLQTTALTGQVTLQNSGNRSAHPAQVQSFGATDTDVGTNDGSFRLEYRNKAPGDKVMLTISKPRYEVVNREELQWLLPANPLVQRRLKLYLCPHGQWREYAARFYKINYQSVMAGYDREVAKAKNNLDAGIVTGETYRNKLNKLQQDLEFTLQEAERLSEIFAKANLDDASERFNQAYQYFSRGLIDSVLIVLDENEMLQDLYRAEREIEDALHLIELGEQMVEEGSALQDLINKAKAWKDSLEREGLDQYCLRLRPDPSVPVGPDYPTWQDDALRIWLLRHRPTIVFTAAGDRCALLRFVRRSLAGQTFSAAMESKYWVLSDPSLTLNADTLSLTVRPTGVLGTIQGQVIALATKLPLVGVQVVGEGQSTLTDQQGRFKIFIPLLRQKLSYHLQFRRDGLPSTTITTEPGYQASLTVELKVP